MVPINVGSVTSGIKLAQYTIEHYRYVMAATGFVTEIAIADRIVRWCHRDQRSEFTRRQAQRPPHLASGRAGGATTTAGGQRLRKVGRSPARGTHRTQTIRHVPCEPRHVAARFCQFCRASSVRRWSSRPDRDVLSIYRSVTTQNKCDSEQSWLVDFSL